ncbi:hypothetical protein JKF63_05073 [Porcisia hertigi]|uniref:ABC transporter domain-containing protein n=1 Tax=Porcisia hertigi TaxID=2761500 RepID=A0A836HTX3_9TRYP|nr:hypothetical protein JKF63_05073 [Porcisia hertigi]
MSTATLTLCCDGVSVQRHQRDGIEDVSCLFRGGRVTAIVNCCGTHSASALLQVMAGRVESTAGNTVLNGIPVSASTCQAQMCFLGASGRGAPGESSGLLAELTVRENLQYASALRVADSAQAYSVDEVLQQLLLGPYEASKMRDCSLYVRRRVAVGKELLLNPSVLLLDEPLEGLATHESQQYLTILSKLAAPSAADAEARRVMREVMRAMAATTCAASDVSLYTPHHSRLNPGSKSSSSMPLDASPNTVTAAAAAATTPNESAIPVEAQRIVVLSMVQPRWTLLQYVHDVVLLERSNCVFVGSVQDMLAVKLPVFVMRSVMAASADGATGRTDEGDSSNTVAATATSSSPYHNHLRSAPADSYDAVDASIRLQRLGEQIVHGLYRLAARATAYPDDGEGAEGVTSASAVPGLSSGIGTEGPSGAPALCSSAAARTLPDSASSGPSIDVDGEEPQTTVLSQLYAHHQLRLRTSVTAYMEACAMGLVELPEASHHPPCSFVQLLHLLRFGLLGLRQNLFWKIFSLVCGLALTAVLAALYGRQGNQEGMQNRVGIIFFLVSCVALQAVLSLDALRREYAAFQRCSTSGYYGAWTYLVFHVVTAALWRFGLASFVALVVFVLSNFGEPWREYRSIFELSVILAVTSFCSHFGIWFLCSWLLSDHVSRFVVFTGYTLNVILAGLVLNLSTLPKAVEALSFVSVVRLAYESCILTQFIGKSFGCGDDAAAVTTATPSLIMRQNGVAIAGLENVSTRPPACTSVACTWVMSDTLAAVQATSCYTGTEYAEFLGFNPSRRWSNVGVLAGISAVLILGSWIMMALYRPRRGA